jgi:hypothetical protein
MDMNDRELIGEFADDKNWLATVQAVTAGHPTYLNLLSGSDPAVRSESAHLLGFLSGSAPEARPVLRAMIERETSTPAKASEILCLGLVDRYLKSPDDMALFHALMRDPQPSLIRAAATITAAHITSPESPDDIVRSLKALATKEIGHDDLPWADGDLANYAAELVKFLGLGPAFPRLLDEVKRKVESLEPDPDGTYDQWTNERQEAWRPSRAPLCVQAAWSHVICL